MSVRKKLEQQLDVVDGKELESHFERAALLLLAPHMDLVEVGAAFAEDNKDLVTAWLQDGDLKRAEVKANAPEVFDVDATYEFLILQPFVIAKKIQPQ